MRERCVVMIEMWEVWIVGEENEREEEHVSGSSAKPGGMGVGGGRCGVGVVKQKEGGE